MKQNFIKYLKRRVNSTWKQNS